MRVYRITDRSYAADPLNGIGAAQAGGRWNSRGIRVAYTGESRSLVLLEMLVHIDRNCVPPSHVLVPIDIPDAAIADLPLLPAGWDRHPYDPQVQSVGDQWIADGTSLALRVPSAVVRGEFNILVNPVHPTFAQVVVHPHEPLVVDARLLL